MVEVESPAILAEIGDAERPIALPAFVRNFVGERPPARRVGKLTKLVGIALVIIIVGLAWQLTPFGGFTGAKRLLGWAAALAQMDGAPAFVIGAFVLGSLIAFPVTLMIAATAATFGPLFGFVYAASGALVSGLVTYLLGVWLGREALDALVGPRVSRIRRGIRRRGVLAIAIVRLVPIAPFALVNLVAGASRIRTHGFRAGHSHWYAARLGRDVAFGPPDLRRDDTADARQHPAFHSRGDWLGGIVDRRAGAAVAVTES